MRRLTKALKNVQLPPGEIVTVDPDVPRGFSHVSYEIDGFNTAYNPLARKVNGRRIQQTVLPIVFESGLDKDVPDGVSVEAILAVCSDHLDTRQQTPNSNEAYAKASAFLKRAIDELVKTNAVSPTR